VSVSRSVLPFADEEDSRYFAGSALRDSRDQVGVIDGLTAWFRGWQCGRQPTSWALILMMLGNIARYIAPAVGWTPAGS
jgi:hypothetical protein